MIEVGLLLKKLFDDLHLNNVQFLSGNYESVANNNLVWFPPKVIQYRRLVEYDFVVMVDDDRLEFYDDFMRALALFGGHTKYIYQELDINNRPVKAYMVELDVASTSDITDEASGQMGISFNTRVCVKDLPLQVNQHNKNIKEI